MRHVRLVLLAPGLVLVLCALGPSPAGASCMGPAIVYESGEVRAGQVITVEGRAWGTECYDYRLPPAGVGGLGEPATGIEIVLSQDGVDEVVARGSAEADYTFVVHVAVPAWLEPGEATVSARYAGGIGFDATDRPLIVLDEPAIEATGGIVVFGPRGEPSATTSTTAPAPTTTWPPPTVAPAGADEDASMSGSGGGGPSWRLPLLVGLGLGAALVAMLVFLRPVTRVTSDPQTSSDVT